MVWAMREEYPQPSTVQWYAAPSLWVSMCLRKSCWFLKLKVRRQTNKYMQYVLQYFIDCVWTVNKLSAATCSHRSHMGRVSHRSDGIWYGSSRWRGMCMSCHREDILYDSLQQNKRKTLRYLCRCKRHLLFTNQGSKLMLVYILDGQVKEKLTCPIGQVTWKCQYQKTIKTAFICDIGFVIGVCDIYRNCCFSCSAIWHYRV